MGYYPNTIKVIRDILNKEYPDMEAKERIDDLPSRLLPPHLLWMLDKIEEMENSPGKAGRWIGYVLRATEEMGFLTHQESRDIVRKDVEEMNKAGR